MDLLKIALGIVTSIAGFLDAGSIATAAEAGASFRYSLIWAILLGTLIVIFANEMTGRLAAVIGGVAYALQLVTGVAYQLWAIVVAFAMWLVLWLGTFGLIENGVAVL